MSRINLILSNRLLKSRGYMRQDWNALTVSSSKYLQQANRLFVVFHCFTSSRCSMVSMPESSETCLMRTYKELRWRHRIFAALSIL